MTYDIKRTTQFKKDVKLMLKQARISRLCLKSSNGFGPMRLCLIGVMTMRFPGTGPENGNAKIGRAHV